VNLLAGLRHGVRMKSPRVVATLSHTAYSVSADTRARVPGRGV
jgi:hypothetical protein